MAKNSGIIKIEGTLEELTFYKKDGVNFVRRKASVSKARIQNDPSYARTRENNQEFAHCSQMSKTLRQAIHALIFSVRDGKQHYRLQQVMAKLKNQDMDSARGMRKVSIGLETPEGKQLLNGFDFNTQAVMDQILAAPYTIDTDKGTVSFANISPVQHVHFPAGATHVAFQSAVLAINFDTGVSDLVLSGVKSLSLDAAATTIKLTVDRLPEVEHGQLLYLLLVSFNQELNGEHYPLRNGAFNALRIIAVP